MSLDLSTNQNSNTAVAIHARGLRKIFGRKAPPGPKAELVDITDLLATNAYHSRKDKGGRALTYHVREVSKEAHRRYGEILEQKDMEQLLIACDTHEITEIKNPKTGKLLWPRSRLLAYRDPNSRMRLPIPVVDRMVLAGRKPGQPYLNYGQGLTSDIVLVRMKICDLTVNTSESRVPPVGPLSRGYMQKKDFLYDGMLDYMLGVENFLLGKESGAIDPNKTNIYTYFRGRDDFRKRVPDYDAQLAENWNPNWQPAPEPVTEVMAAWFWQKAARMRVRTLGTLGL